MGEVIEFPGIGEAAINRAMDYFRSAYLEAGLAEDQIAVAMNELKPIIRQLLVRQEFVMTIPDHSFSDEQVQLITEVHNSCMHDAIKYFGQQLWISICMIAGLIGRSVSR